LKKAGADRLGIALDAATEKVFNNTKGKDAGGIYKWDEQFRLLQEALTIFGAGNVSTHIIVGLGETELEVVEIVQRCTDLGILPALFAFTPIRGTALESNAPPKVESYRRVQLARYLIVNGKSQASNMRFDDLGKIVAFGLEKKELKSVIECGAPFQTSGCPNCNRPYYNEKPSGPIYNYPYPPSKEERSKIKEELT
jgi:biotin synthase